jgi:hypothetical protein
MGGKFDPSVKLAAFACPYCGIVAKQRWKLVGVGDLRDATPTLADPSRVRSVDDSPGAAEKLREALERELWRPEIDERNGAGGHLLTKVHASACDHCARVALWVHDRLVYPPSPIGTPAHPDAPESVRADIEEARTILRNSPRAAAALIRLALEKLCNALGETGKIDEMIGSLVAKGLPVQIQQALDTVRVIGNEGVHPGTIDLRDDHGTVIAMLDLMHMIVENRISEPKKIVALYNRLPAKKIEGIDRRDGRHAAPDPQA